MPLPDRAGRRALLDVLLRTSPLATDVHLDEVAERTPGFVAADLLALRREAAVRAAAHATACRSASRRVRVVIHVRKA